MIAADTQTLSYAAAFVAGVAGSAHCFVMCGGLASALGMRARRRGVSPQTSFAYAATSQLGRVLSYTLAGALVGAFGGVFASLLDFSSAAAALRVAAGLLLIALALKVLFKWNLLSWLERAGGKFWRFIAPLSQHIGVGGFKRSFLLGTLWGWLPCGLVYSILLFAAFSGDAWRGAGTMLAFGVGTLPAMLSSSLLASQLTRLTIGRKIHLGAGALLLAFGIWTAAAPFQVHEGHEHSMHATHAM
jgi:sulfite exporter TauE/SafE